MFKRTIDAFSINFFVICSGLLSPLFKQGENEPKGPDLLFHWADGESQSLLQAFHNMDQPEDSKNLCTEKHV